MHGIWRAVILVAFAAALTAGVSAQPAVFVTTTDFQTGSTAFLPADGGAVATDLLLIHADAAPTYFDGRIYVLSRLGEDNVLVLDPQELERPLLQFSVGNGSNPQSIVFANSSKAYVSRFASTSLLIVDPSDGVHLCEIDLSEFADEDGFPEMGPMAIAGERLYVACPRLDANNFWTPSPTSYLAVIDTGTDALVDMDAATDGIQGIELRVRNPNTVIALGNALYVAGSAAFGDREGGIERIDLVDYSSMVVIDEENLQGDVSKLVLASSRRAYAIVLDENFANSVLPLDLVTGEVGEALADHSGGFTPDLATDGTYLVVADRDTFEEPDRAGLLIYDAATGVRIKGPVPVGLPPPTWLFWGRKTSPQSSK